MQLMYLCVERADKQYGMMPSSVCVTVAAVAEKSLNTKLRNAALESNVSWVRSFGFKLRVLTTVVVGLHTLEIQYNNLTYTNFCLLDS